jgi:hypothetical protein
VFHRPAGGVRQEIGGVLVTLAALCNAWSIDMNKAGDDELVRCWLQTDAISAKHAAKPKFGPLPAAVAVSVTPDIFWDAEDPETPYDSINDLLDNYVDGDTVECLAAARVPSFIAVRMPVPNSDEHECCTFDTREAAAAWVAERQRELDSQDEPA